MGNVVYKNFSKLMLMGFLTLITVSCSRPLSELQAGDGDIGFTYCDGTLGSFDIYVVRHPQDFTLFELYVIPVEVADSGPAMVTIAYNDGSDRPPYRTLVSQTTFVPGNELYAGYITENDLLTYDILALTQFDGNAFPDGTGELDAFCTLPLPGEGTDGFEQSFAKKASRRGMAIAKSRTRGMLKRNAKSK